jgi:signal transduction histidine kinase
MLADPVTAPDPVNRNGSSTSSEVRDLWVNARLVSVLMEQSKTALLATVLALPLFILVLLHEVSHVILTGWALLVIALMGYRHHIISVYRSRLEEGQADDATRLAYVRRHGWTWTASGLLWGGLIGMVFPQASPLVQFVCGFIVLIHGLLSLATFSVYLPIFNRYVYALMASVVSGLVAPILMGWGPSVPSQDLVAISLVFPIFWWVLRSTARRLSGVHRSSLELLYSNQELIHSLTAQARALEQAVSTKNRFLASTAHDLRQPVHALSLYAEWLADEPDMAPDIAPRIQQSTRAINELFDSLFDLTRIDAGNYKVRLQQVDVQQLLTDVVLQFEPVAAAKSLALRTHARPGTLWADPVMLRRILGNLVSNALRHTHEGGVLIALRYRGNQLVFEVWDTGVGIAPEHQEAIFQEFFRVSQHQGTEDSLGLGLTIVSRLANLMGYQLSLRSVPGRGSVFRVTMPAFSPEPSILTESSHTP